MDRVRSLLGTVLVLICFSAIAASSSLTWTWRNPPLPDFLAVAAYGGGTYVVAGQDGVIFSSHDGNTWALRSSVIGKGGEYVGALYANGLFLLSGLDAAGATHVTSSPDGVHWTDSKLTVPGIAFVPELPKLELTFGNGIYILMGDGVDATSPDGITWTTHTLGFTATEQEFPSLLSANGVFIMQGNSGPQPDIYYSTDGVTWNASTSLQGIGTQGPYASDGNTFYLFYENDTIVYTSTDGDNWTQHTPTGSFPIQETFMLWDGARFRTIGFDSSAHLHVFSSSNGLAWTAFADLPTATGLPSGSAPIFDGTHYLAVDSAGFVETLRSTDFATWTPALVASTGLSVDFTGMVYGEKNLVAIGGTAIVQSPDGTTWHQVYTSSQTLASIAYGNGVYLAAGANTLLRSTDSVHWEPVTLPPTSTFDDIEFGNGRFVALTGCSPQCTTATSTDGETWVSHQQAGLTAGGDLGYDGTRFVSIRSLVPVTAPDTAIAPVYTSCDGVTWTHSADISTSEFAEFGRIRPLGNNKLVALGDINCAEALNDNVESCDAADGQLLPILATSTDASHWSIATFPGFTGDGGTFSDATTDGKTDYVSVGISLDGEQGGSSILTSTDAVHWTASNGVPASASVLALAYDGRYVYGAGAGGDIIAAAVSGGSSSGIGGTCTPLPAVADAGPTPGTQTSSSGGGGLDLFILIGLFGLMALRRIGR
ncbi:MAG TPA: hypothetical protein VGM47_04270 [Gammaproteobacteria bacterium]